MYADSGSGFYFPTCFQSFPSEFQQYDEIMYRIPTTNTPNSTFVQSLQPNCLAEYDLSAESDLFKAPEPMIEEESILDIDPLTTAAISIISGTSDDVAEKAIEAAVQLDPILDGPLQSNIFYDCKKDLMEKSTIGVLEVIPEDKLPVLEAEECGLDDAALRLQKSVSSGCLTSMEWVNSGSWRPTFLDFQGLNLDAAIGMRRSFSEGDIQTLGYVTPTQGCVAQPLSTQCERPLTIGNYTIEERMQSLHRYRKKKSKRNFNRKIKYACRKALADSQPRVRGRFARSEDCESSTKLGPPTTSSNHV